MSLLRLRRLLRLNVGGLWLLLLLLLGRAHPLLVRLDRPRQHGARERRRLLKHLPVLRSVLVDGLLSACGVAVNCWQLLTADRRPLSLRLRAGGWLRQCLTLVARSRRRRSLLRLFGSVRVSRLLPIVARPARAFVMMVMLLVLVLVMGGCCRDVVTRVHRRVCVELEMESRECGGFGIAWLELTAVCPFDVIAFILLLNFDGLRSRICKYSSVSCFSTSVVTFSST